MDGRNTAFWRDIQIEEFLCLQLSNAETTSPIGLNPCRTTARVALASTPNIFEVGALAGAGANSKIIIKTEVIIGADASRRKSWNAAASDAKTLHKGKALEQIS